jgi:hypothetical protein
VRRGFIFESFSRVTHTNIEILRSDNLELLGLA